MAYTEYTLNLRNGVGLAVLESNCGELWIGAQVIDQQGISYWSQRLGRSFKAIEQSLVYPNSSVYVLVSKLDFDSYHIGCWRLNRIVGNMFRKLDMSNDDSIFSVERVIFNMLVEGI